MKAIAIKGLVRENLGKKDSKSLRNEGMVPCVIYGANDPVHFVVDERAFKQIVYTPNVYIINIDVNGTSYTTVLKDIQFHPVNERVLHADFFAPKEGQEVTLKLPIVLNGNAIGVLNGGKLRMPQRRLTVKGLLNNMPDAVEVEISKLRIGQGIRVSEMNIENIEFLDAPNNYVVFIKTARGAVDTGSEEEEAAEAENA